MGSSDVLPFLGGLVFATLMIHAVVLVHAPTAASPQRSVAEEYSRALFIIATWPVWVVLEIGILVWLVGTFWFQRKNKEE